MKKVVSGVCAGLLLATSISIVGRSVSSHDTHSQEDVMQTLVTKSDYIFRGTVTNMQYAVHDDIPYTYVTYKVENYVKNNLSSNIVTLRFIGGPDGNGNVLEVSGVPDFDIGDKDILAVSGNGQDICPLVECGLGRLRIENNQVYSNTGEIIQINENGDVKFGGAVILQGLQSNRVGDAIVHTAGSNLPTAPQLSLSLDQVQQLLIQESYNHPQETKILTTQVDPNQFTPLNVPVITK